MLPTLEGSSLRRKPESSPTPDWIPAFAGMTGCAGQLVSRRYASAAFSGSLRTSSISTQLAVPYMCGR